MTATAFAQPPERRRCGPSARARTSRARLEPEAARPQSVRRSGPGNRPHRLSERTAPASTRPARPRTRHCTDRSPEGGTA